MELDTFWVFTKVFFPLIYIFLNSKINKFYLKDPPSISYGGGGSNDEFLDKGMIESDGDFNFC